MRLIECTHHDGKPITINVDAIHFFAPAGNAPDTLYVSFGRPEESVTLKETYATFKERLNASRG
ncbi:MAG TPA: hypothetical protein V6C81_09685 [Planktothrix sp.]|jgi:hypothetical protein